MFSTCSIRKKSARESEAGRWRETERREKKASDREEASISTLQKVT